MHKKRKETKYATAVASSRPQDHPQFCDAGQLVTLVSLRCWSVYDAGQFAMLVSY